MYFPIMGRNLFCWLIVRLGVGGWGLCMYAGLVFRGVAFVERKKGKKRKKKKLTCKNENFPP